MKSASLFCKSFLVVIIFISSLSFNFLSAQTSKPTDEEVVKQLFDAALKQGKCYGWLDELCNGIGGRLSGSPEAEKAVQWGKKLMEQQGFDRVYLQEVMVPHWVRGEKEKAELIPSLKGKKKQTINISALGGSVCTPKKGIEAEVIEVRNFEELATLGREKIEGKIVFFNRPMEPTHTCTFDAYGGAVNQRGRGAIEAAKYGALAAIVRSMTLAYDEHPHTGAMRYLDTITKVPAAAISTKGAELLSQSLKEDPKLKIRMEMQCQALPDVKSYNVIGEIKGSEFPDEIIVIGGHLDSWDTGQGAHDDGAGIVQSIEALRLFKTLGIRPKRTIRAVLFMNEENGMRGGLKYAEEAKKLNEKHIAAIESDRGGFTPRGFSMGGGDKQVEKVMAWKKLFEKYDMHEFTLEGGGVDIGPLKNQDVLLMELLPDSQRYFDYHHSPSDTFDKVNKRELELGAAALTSMLYLLSEHGL